MRLQIGKDSVCCMGTARCMCLHYQQHFRVILEKGRAPEADEVNDIEGGDVVGAASKVVLPEALLPEAEPLHFAVVVAERRVRQRRALHQPMSPLCSQITLCIFTTHYPLEL